MSKKYLIPVICGAAFVLIAVSAAVLMNTGKNENNSKKVDLQIEQKENGTFEVNTQKAKETETDGMGFLVEETLEVPEINVDGEQDDEITLYKENADMYTTLYGQGGYVLDDYCSVQEEYKNMFVSSNGTYQSDEEVTNELIKVRNMYRSFKFENAADEIIYYVENHNFSGETDRVKEMFQLYMDAFRILDIFSEETAESDVIEYIPYVVDPETNLLVTLGSIYGYETILNQDCIGLYGNKNIVNTGEYVDKKDRHYYDAERCSSFDIDSIYRFKIKYNSQIDIYAYVVINSIGCSHVYSFENEDGSFISPKERESIEESINETTVDYSWDSGIYNYQDQVE